jgi:hypothetical protein
MFRLAMEPTKSPIEWVAGGSFLWTKVAGARSWPLPPLYVFMVCTETTLPFLPFIKCYCMQAEYFHCTDTLNITCWFFPRGREKHRMQFWNIVRLMSSVCNHLHNYCCENLQSQIVKWVAVSWISRIWVGAWIGYFYIPPLLNWHVH